MKASRQLTLSAALFAACALVGWLAGKTSSAPAGPGSSAAVAGKATKTDRASAKSALPSEVLAMLEPVRAAKNTEERLRATIQLAENIPLADIEKWLGSTWFDCKGDMQANLFTRTLLSRWQEADPGAMLDYCLKKEMRTTYEFAGEWARRDPGAVLAHIEQEKDPRKRSSMISYMGDAAGKADPQAALSCIRSLMATATSEDSYPAARMIAGLASSAPDLLKAEAAKWPKAMQDLAMKSLVSASLKKDFTRGLAELGSQEGGKLRFMDAVNDDSNLLKGLAKNLASLPSGWLGDLISRGSASYYLVQDDPEKWLEKDPGDLGLDENQFSQLRQSALGQLALKNPEKLKSLLAGEDLNENERNNAISNLVSNMPAAQAKEWIAGLTKESDIVMAKATLAGQSRNEEGAITPTGLLSSLADTERVVNWTEARATGTWGREQMQALNDGFDALPADKKALVAGKFIANQYEQGSSVFTAKAVSYLLANPGSEPPKADPGEDPFGGGRRRNPLANTASRVAASWVEQDPAAASSWVKSLPAGEARRWAARNMVARWGEYEPAAARQWIASMPAGERGELEKALQSRNNSR